MSDKIIKVDTAVSSAIGLTDALEDKSLATNRCPATEKFYEFDEKDLDSDVAITTVQCELQRGHEGDHKGKNPDERWSISVKDIASELSDIASEYLLKSQKAETIEDGLCFARTPVPVYGAPLTPVGIRCERLFNHDGDHVGGIDDRLRWQGCDARKDNRRCSLQRSHTSMLHISGDVMWGGERVVNIGEALFTNENGPPKNPLNASSAYLTAEQIASYAAGYAIGMVAPGGRQIPLNPTYDFQVPFGPGIVPAQGSLILTATLDRYFRGENLVCTPPVAPGLYITQIIVGATLQFPPRRRAIPVGGLFSLGNNVRWDTCAPGFAISLLIENRAKIPLDFQAVLFGKAATNKPAL